MTLKAVDAARQGRYQFCSKTLAIGHHLAHYRCLQAAAPLCGQVVTQASMSKIRSVLSTHEEGTWVSNLPFKQSCAKVFLTQGDKRVLRDSMHHASHGLENFFSIQGIHSHQLQKCNPQHNALILKSTQLSRGLPLVRTLHQRIPSQIFGHNCNYQRL